ncbi:hypothetical protein GCM10012320_33880 [Sinomonas cellulolyticus]|uniref:Uncharacterized protein n=1 Tax=Sinomonas cellulolyticus TaxID=2801916 RepID=A0ABS1K5P2_9MICC|nr:MULTISPECIES: hypothetical protein [Sinomonas]MBL0706999.1 hypothetical protein [Sinomonas cellulolyticus]GHG59654.1 hypothetical protein GCM10012320_33880 [Sinomonas sp. KCTC 49339]
MAPYTKELDQAWIEGRTTQPEPAATEQQAQSLHPQVHALQHALAQLKAARYWPQADPDVQDAVRAAAAAIADELAHHTHPDDTGTEAAPQAAGPRAGRP